jgi:MYXO-CTERM domain-containing protein
MIALSLSVACSVEPRPHREVGSRTSALDGAAGGVWKLRDRGGISADDHFRFVYHAAMQKVLLVSARPNRGVFAWDGREWSFVAEPSGAWFMQGAVYDEARERVVLFGGLEADHVGAGNTNLTLVLEKGAWQALTAGGPAAGGGAAMAYDAARDRIVLSGGADHTNGTPRDDTWLFDGEAWSEATVAASPASQYAGAAFDRDRERVVLLRPVDGSASETWEWDGSEWTQRQPASALPYAYQYGLAYDSQQERVVSLVEGALWAWDGATWKRVGESDGREAERGTASVAYDEARKRLVTYRPQQNVTWEHDGTSWQAIRASRPRARQGAASAYDAARQRVVYFGGTTEAADATWEWDGTTWTRGAAAMSATPSGLHMAHDTQRKRTVMVTDGSTWEYDGKTWRNAGAAPGTVSLLAYHEAHGVSVALIDGATWAWDGTSWSDTGSGAPTGVRDGAMAYDAARERLVCFGGYTDGSGDSEIDETWEWDGSAWTRMSPAVSPSPRGGHGMAFDSRRQRIVLYGGYYANELWDYDGTTWALRMAQPAPPGSFSNGLVYDAARDRMVFFASDGTLWEYHPVGEPCESGDVCASGSCVQGVCCDRACTSSCESCSVQGGAATDGICELWPDAGSDCESSATDAGSEAPGAGKKSGGCAVTPRSAQPGEPLAWLAVGLALSLRRRAPTRGTRSLRS